MYFIYQIKNKVNGKIYIGYTRQLLKSRWRRHVTESKKPNKKYRSSLYQAMNKYGHNSFEIEKIAESDVSTLEDALKAETLWILKLESYKKEKGYNMKISQSYPDSTLTEEFKKESSIRSQGHKRRPGTSQYVGVNARHKKSPYAVIAVRGKIYSKNFPSELECAEFYDKMALYFFGKDARVNFESRKNEFLSLNLKDEIKTIFLSFREKRNVKYVGIKKRVYVRSDGSMVSVYQMRLPRTSMGTFDNEDEAAEVRDKIILYLGLDKLKRTILNFPNRREEFLSQDLKALYEERVNRPAKRKARI